VQQRLGWKTTLEGVGQVSDWPTRQILWVVERIFLTLHGRGDELIELALPTLGCSKANIDPSRPIHAWFGVFYFTLKGWYVGWLALVGMFWPLIKPYLFWREKTLSFPSNQLRSQTWNTSFAVEGVSNGFCRSIKSNWRLLALTPYAKIYLTPFRCPELAHASFLRTSWDPRSDAVSNIYAEGGVSGHLSRSVSSQIETHSLWHQKISPPFSVVRNWHDASPQEVSFWHCLIVFHSRLTIGVVCEITGRYPLFTGALFYVLLWISLG
jgi:hypothetical protein